ncbi:MAG TPA: TetR/AcrR family transcriptional regulator [Candidatus Limnocylindria bacterium]|jgi:TetR/AcrR family transcriptional repressor of nem operon|nr:TetR/AcrR family transcriptional regulator [Candidatus Limnocylindria bacterium]
MEKQERREELVLAAYRLLAERGFEGLRTRDVAGKVGVNIATLHYHFPTKEALIRGVVAHAMSRFRSTLSASGSPGVKLRGHFRGLRRLARDEPELFAVMGELALRARRDRGMAALIRETDDVWHATLRGLLRLAQREGVVAGAADADDVAGLIVAAMKGTFLLPAESRSPRRLNQALDQLERWLGL